RRNRRVLQCHADRQYQPRIGACARLLSAAVGYRQGCWIKSTLGMRMAGLSVAESCGIRSTPDASRIWSQRTRASVWSAAYPSAFARTLSLAPPDIAAQRHEKLEI